MAARSGKGCLVATFLWLVILGILAVAAKYWLLPKRQAELVNKTGSQSRFKTTVSVATDSFSGYSVLRSPKMASLLAQQGIRLAVEDDKSDIPARIRKLQHGQTQMAVFTVDSYLTAGAQLGGFPGSIVLVIDETKGADAVVGYEGAIGTLKDLNRPDARIVLTPGSPSEFLARTIIAHFNLPALSAQWMIEAKGVEDVYDRFRGADKKAPCAYVLWEPYVSRALEEPGAKLLLDSSRFQGFILDVLVAERNFLRDSPTTARQVIEAYLRGAYEYSRSEDGMATLIVEDARQLGAPSITPEQARKLVKGIEWKNTLENYACFGLLSAAQSQGATHIEDAIDKILDVLIRTGALQKDPTGGRTNLLFYGGLLGQLQAADFHPAKQVSVMTGVGPGAAELDGIRRREALRPLSDAEWDGLQIVGEMRIDPIEFARGTSRLSIQGDRTLGELAKMLQSWPQYYVKVTGHARTGGDYDANVALARERAKTAMDSLIAKSVDGARIKTIVGEPEEDVGGAQSVTFWVGQIPY